MENGGYCWEGSFVRGKDILNSLRGGMTDQVSPNKTSKLLRRQLGIARHQRFPSTKITPSELHNIETNNIQNTIHPMDVEDKKDKLESVHSASSGVNTEVPRKELSIDSRLSGNFAAMDVTRG